MKVPAGIFGPDGKAAKGWVHLKGNGVELTEYGTALDGKYSTCYVPTYPGDVIAAGLAIHSGVGEEFIDLVVDGVLRSSTTNKRAAKIHRYTFDRACFSGIQIGATKRTATRNCSMKVESRNAQRDLEIDGNGDQSAVSSIEVQIFRKEVTVEVDDGHLDPIQTVPSLTFAQRAPSFVKYPSWSDVNRHISSEGPVPPYEIGFFDGSKYVKEPTDRVVKEWASEYKLWASFKFLLRSTTDLTALGFRDVAIDNPPLPKLPKSLNIADGQSKIENSSIGGKLKVESIEFGCVLRPNSGERGLVLPGMQSAPAHKAWLERGQTEETELTECQSPSTPQTGLSHVFRSTEASQSGTLSRDQNLLTRVADTQQLVETCSDLDGKSYGKTTAHKSFQSPDWEPLSPPPRSSKIRFYKQESEPESIENGVGQLRITTPTLTQLVDNSTGKDDALQSRAESTNSSSAADGEEMASKPKPALGIDNSSEHQTAGIKVDQNSSQSHAATTTAGSVIETAKYHCRRSSPTPSETPTEVADHHDLEVSRLQSLRTSNRSLDGPAKEYSAQHSVSPAPEQTFKHPEESPILGYDILMKALGNQTDSGVSAVQEAILLETLSSTNVPFVEAVEVPLSSTGLGLIADRQRPRSATPTPQDVISTAGDMGGVHLEKRKADCIDRGSPDIPAVPRKTGIAPALRNSYEIERQKEVAEARIAAAKIQGDELRRQLEAALELQRERVRVQKLNQEADQIERENAELQSKIAALYGKGDGKSQYSH